MAPRDAIVNNGRWLGAMTAVRFLMLENKVNAGLFCAALFELFIGVGDDFAYYLSLTMAAAMQLTFIIAASVSAQCKIRTPLPSLHRRKPRVKSSKYVSFAFSTSYYIEVTLIGRAALLRQRPSSYARRMRNSKDELTSSVNHHRLVSSPISSL